jgi:hypothetical protein
MFGGLDDGGTAREQDRPVRLLRGHSPSKSLVVRQINHAIPQHRGGLPSSYEHRASHLGMPVVL